MTDKEAQPVRGRHFGCRSYPVRVREYSSFGKCDLLAVKMHSKMLSHASLITAFLSTIALAADEYYTVSPILPNFPNPIINPAPLFTIPTIPTNFPWMQNGGNGGGGYYTAPNLPPIVNPLPTTLQSTLYLTNTATVPPLVASTAGGILNPPPAFSTACALTTILSTQLNTIPVTVELTTTVINTVTTVSVQTVVLSLTSSICPALPTPPPLVASTADGILTSLPSVPTGIVPIFTYVPIVATGLPPLGASTALGVVTSLIPGLPTALPYIPPVVPTILPVPPIVASTALGLLPSVAPGLPTALPYIPPVVSAILPAPPLVASTALGILTSPPSSVPTGIIGGGGIGATATLGYYGYPKREVDEKREPELEFVVDDGGLGGEKVKRCVGKRGIRGKRGVC